MAKKIIYVWCLLSLIVIFSPKIAMAFFEYGALVDAAASDDANEINRLIEMGLSPNKPEQPWSALHEAALRNSIRAVRALIAAGADVNALDGHRWTPLHIAAMKNNLEVVFELLNAGANKRIQDSNGQMPIEYAWAKNYIAVSCVLTFLGR